jgi:hypothetical protein
MNTNVGPDSQTADVCDAAAVADLFALSTPKHALPLLPYSDFQFSSTFSCLQQDL